ncbi:hypothetical protein [Flavobacterium acetivorans]|uniref:hypothetical protein n=1 Tax=Flavobacterium acetivorans TaxID=2893883 RepID=UPI001E4E63DD|nr:hypothetical protein [Flavobacterium sp. F-29]UFH34509.1 hypothetical protein LNP19_10440 [Flavobacterium sp. F-29]
MKTKIYEAIQQWIPDSKNWIDLPSTSDETIHQYTLLKSVAKFCIERMDSVDELIRITVSKRSYQSD